MTIGTYGYERAIMTVAREWANTHAEAARLAERIERANNFIKTLSEAHELTPHEVAALPSAKTDRDEARKSLHALVLRATGLTAETIGELV